MGNTREYSGMVRKAVGGLAIVMSLYHVLYISDFLHLFGVFVYPEAHMAAHLGFALALTFLVVPPRKGAARHRMPWYDILLLMGGVGWNAYIVFNFETVYEHTMAGGLTAYESVMTWVMILVILEAARRFFGLAIPLVAAGFIFYAIFTDWFPGLMHAPSHDPVWVGRYIGLFTTGMYGKILGISATVVAMFLIFAQFLSVSGAGDWFISISESLLGHVRGGPAKVAVVASAMMGTIAGQTTANVATTGTITIPMMKKVGYTPEFAAAIEAAASNGGQIMPPVMGIAAFIMVDLLGVSYGRIALAAALPAILYFVALLLMVDLEAAKMGLKGMPRNQLPKVRKALSKGWHFLAPLVLLVVLLMVLQYSAQKAALYSLLLLLLVGLLKQVFTKEKPLSYSMILRGLESGAFALMNVAVICAIAGIIVGCVNITGLGFRLSMILVTLGGGNLFLLLILTAVVCIILGMGMTTSAVYLLVAILVAPALIEVGIPAIAAHFFVFYFGVASLITPPVCPASYVAAGIAGAKPMKTGLMASRLGIVTFLIPFVFVLNPALLMEGTIINILWASVTTITGAAALAVGFQGYLLTKINWLQRIVVMVAAITLIMPTKWVAAIGFALLLPVVIGQLRTQRAIRRAT